MRDRLWGAQGSSEGKRSGYRVAPGSFESAQMVLKDVFWDETTGVSDTSFWINREELATMNLPCACFQFYLAGVDHKSLAAMLLDDLPRVRSSRLTGDIPPKEWEGIRTRVANALLPHYPRKYRERLERKIASK